jgi:uncharacterized SAM-binding protein YcdF (DUF218 family)
MRQIAHFLINPLIHFWIALLAGLFLSYRGSKKLSYWIIGYAVLWLFLTSISPLPVYFAKQREARYPVLWQIPDTLPAPNILILGAGFSTDPTLPPNTQLSRKALSRLSEGIRLKNQHFNAKLIGSGYAGSKDTPQATVLMNAAVALGVSPIDTLQSTQPFNTETEAIAYAHRFGTTTPLILVTSALHMPRALYWFRQQGIDAIPAPTDHYVKPDPKKSPYTWKPSTTKIEITGALLHEWVGMIYAKWYSQ